MSRSIEGLLSKGAKATKRSVIRELLKLTQQPEIISFAGGLPAPDTFPVKEVKEIVQHVLDTEGTIVLQYSPTEGEAPLREELAKWMSKDGINVTPENIIVTTGSQQGLDLLSAVFIDPGDPIIVELPSYIGGLQAFQAHLANMVGVKQDDEGMRMDLLEEALAKLKSEGKKPKFVYVVPDFQNPSGVTLTEERRHRLLELAYEYDVLVVEDSPYRELRFEGKSPTPIMSLDKHGHVIMLCTLSKLFCPGMRIGWALGPKDIISRFVVAKQAVDLCSPAFTQRITAEFLRRGLLPGQIKGIIEKYHRKRDIMLAALQEHMPEGVTWTHPDGGLFLWVRLPEHMDSEKLFTKAVEKKVAYVVGAPFHCDGSGKNTMRVNFSFSTEEDVKEGVKRLAEAVREEM